LDNLVSSNPTRLVRKDEAARLGWKNECEGWLQMGRAAGAGGTFFVEDLDGLAAAWWQEAREYAEDYLLVQPDYRGDLGSLLEPLTPVLEERRTRTVLRYLEAAEKPEWRSAAAAQGFTFKGTSPLMACRLDAPSTVPTANEKIEVRKVRSPKGYEKAFRIIQEAFGGPASLTRFFNPFGHVSLYLGFWDGCPAASGTVWPAGGCAGFYSIATRGAFRRRGLALAVLQGLMDEARELGFDTASLRTSQHLEPLYEKSGFQVSGRVLRWIRE
jgi:GNAT superfamily N-acetyltransferase